MYVRMLMHLTKYTKATNLAQKATYIEKKGSKATRFYTSSSSPLHYLHLIGLNRVMFSF